MLPGFVTTLSGIDLAPLQFLPYLSVLSDHGPTPPVPEYLFFRNMKISTFVLAKNPKAF